MNPSFRVGSTVQDLCRPCKMVRKHTVLVAGGDVCRVICDYCGSQHNYRGGEQAAARGATSRPGRATARPAEPVGVVSERERSAEPMSYDDAAKGTGDLEMLLRRVIREEAGVTPLAPAERWRGGEMLLKPGREGVQDKSWPIETFFHKIVMVRNRLRTMEQQINASDLPPDAKLKLQSYLTACYGSLTSFNVLFAEEADRFRGAGSPK